MIAKEVTCCPYCGTKLKLTSNEPYYFCHKCQIDFEVRVF